MGNKKIKVISIFGTRPEAIKLAPVLMELNARHEEFESIVCVTAQHREMLDQALQIFDIKPHYDLGIMMNNQSLEHITSSVVTKVTDVLKEVRPDVVIVQGDTTTTFAASLSAFYQKIKIAHVEAGLRTRNKHHPFPEEINRHITSVLSDFHFAPTNWAKQNLIREGHNPETIFVVGNTVIDALLYIREKIHDGRKITSPELPGLNGKKLILVTGHRRESFGRGFENICNAIAAIAERDDVEIIYPVHPNPNVREPVSRILAGKRNVRIVEPMNYQVFVALMEQAYVILTDSGGIQEEAPTFGKPVLIMRETTERPEGIEAGVARLVGTNVAEIVKNVNALLENGGKYMEMATKPNPYGDGKAAGRIVDLLEQKLRKG